MTDKKDEMVNPCISVDVQGFTFKYKVFYFVRPEREVRKDLSLPSPLIFRIEDSLEKILCLRPGEPG